MYSCGIFLDLNKAFDTVNHTILLKKRENSGIRGIVQKWFSSYLSNRKQYVSIAIVVSEQKPITCGVPQGSVLGPLLFLLYINDFNNSAPKLKFNLFADDSNLFYSDNNLQTLEIILNEQLILVGKWLCANKFSINIEKSNFVLFHSPQNKVNYLMNLKIHNNKMKEKKS
jgi:retron-type reverse transcriptase